MTVEIDLEDQLILIVDDNPTNLGVLADYLEDHEFDIMTALYGEDGIEKAQRRRPDIILLDVMMPGIDGFEVCRRLKADKTTKDIPIIFMTALASEEDKVKGFDAGAVDYVTKPIQQRDVLARVTTHLQIRKQARQLQEQNEALITQNAISKSLHQVASILNSSLERDVVLDKIMEQLKQVIQYDGACIFLHENDKLLISQAVGFSVRYLEHSIDITSDASSAMVFREKRSIVISDARHDSRWQRWHDGDPIHSWMGAPLLIDTEPIGVLTIDSFTVGAYTEKDIQIIETFANQAAIAIENARLYSEVVKVNADKDKFFSIVAHDLKGPFLPLLGNSQLLEEMAFNLSPKEVKDMGGSIHRSAKRVFELLENLLQWSRIQMGRMEYNPRQLNLQTLVAKSIGLLETTAQTKKVALHNEIATNIFVYADEYMLDTVIRNLINNALKFTPEDGQVTIKCQKLDEPLNRNFVEISILDTGVGISQADIDKLFKIETHHSTTGTAKETGTGLGLIMCKEMVEMNRGKIWIESELGRGTTIKFTVPTEAIQSYKTTVKF